MRASVGSTAVTTVRTKLQISFVPKPSNGLDLNLRGAWGVHDAAEDAMYIIYIAEVVLRH